MCCSPRASGQSFGKSLDAMIQEALGGNPGDDLEVRKSNRVFIGMYQSLALRSSVNERVSTMIMGDALLCGKGRGRRMKP